MTLLNLIILQTKYLAVFCLFFAVNASMAQGATVYSEQGELIKASQNVAVFGSDIVGDKINLYTGGVEFTETDVSLPGNNSLPVSVGRRYVTALRRQNMYEGLFVDWDLEIPHLHGIYASGNASWQGWVVWAGPGGAASKLQRCSNFQAPPVQSTATHAIVETDDYWSGHFLYVPGRGDEKLLMRDPAITWQPADGYAYPVVTKSNWQFRCITGLASPLTASGTDPAGEGFIARSPDGTQYRFDWMVSRPYIGISTSTGGVARQEVWVMPTVVTDRFGNTVTYAYDRTDPWKLLSITGSDERIISLTYGSGHRVSAVSNGSQTWYYTYGTSASGVPRLSSVTLPDGSAWNLNLNEQGGSPAMSPANRCNGGQWSDGTVYPNTLTSTISHPSGAVVSFVMEYVMHARSGFGDYSSFNCQALDSNAPTPVYPARSLKSKSINGPGLSPLNWTYSYSAAPSSVSCGSNCPATKSVTVTDPRGYITLNTFGNYYNSTEGQLQRIDEGWDGFNAARTTTFAYRVAGAGPYPTYPGDSGSTSGDDAMETRYLPMYQKTVYQQGARFSWSATGFDTLARVVSLNRASSLGYTRNESTAYYDRPDLWVIGQVMTQTVADFPYSSKTFYPDTGLPKSVLSFNKLENSYSYNSDGTLNSVADGNGNSTVFSSYNRGLAQSIQYANGNAVSADVNNIGRITRYTNEVGTTWTFGYDAMGRLASATPPGGDATGYNTRYYSFAPSGGADYGLAAGYWRHTATEGSAVTVQYFDALWRKRMTLSYDSAQPGTTQRMQSFRYDSDNRTTFAAYPVRSIGSVDDAVPGTATVYDPLGRPYQTIADSELGQLVSTTQYLPGFQKQVVNARGKVTTTAYQAFDEPSMDHITSVSAPEGVVVSIQRDVFGKATSITRGGAYAGGNLSATRNYVYDQYQLLCKTVEPEIGATIQEYDAANNILWKATGLSLTATNNCNRGDVQ